MRPRALAFGSWSVLSVLGACVPGVDGGGNDFPVPERARPPTPASFSQVVTSDRPPPPISGGTLRVLSDGITAVAADPDRDVVWVADLNRGSLRATVALQDGDEPGRSAEDAEGRVHVVLRRGGAIVTLTPPTFAVTARRPVCPAPRGIAFDARAGLLHVACAGGELVSLAPDPQETTPVRTLDLGRDLRDVVATGGRLFVSRFRSAEVLTVGADGRIERTLTPPGRRTQRPVQTSKDRFTTKDVTLAPGVAWRMLPTGAGDVMVVHQLASGEEVSVAPGGYASVGCTGLVATAVSRVGPAGTRTSPGIMRSALPVDLALSPDGKQIAIASAGNAYSGAGTVQVVTPELLESEGECIGPGFFGARPSPPTDAGSPSGDGILDEPIEFRQPPTGEAIAVAFTPRGHLLVQTREPAAIHIATASRRIELPGASRFDTGHAVFHHGTGFTSLACASCHPEGGEDARVWTFQKIGPRRTQSLRGGILKTAPFHWDGDLTDVSHLMKEVFESRMNGPLLGPDHHKALAGWMDTIPGLPASPHKDPAAVERGRLVYASAGCATCHTGDLLTDNKTVDVGTGRKLQVPSLKGISFRAPFMHDGCAPTMEARFQSKECGGGDRHGVTSTLTPAQRADLTAFLESL